MTTPAAGADIPDGRPRAVPIYLVDQNGNPINTTNGLSVTAAVQLVAGTALTATSGLPVNPQQSATGTLTSVAAAVSNTQLLALNTSRKGAYFFNDGTSIMYLAFNATASTTSYTVQVPANGFFEMPTFPVYTGQINAVWPAANGNARITEMS